jgi:surface-anchored protein
VLSIGHVDAVEVSVSGNSLRLQIKDDTTRPSTFRNPASTTLQAKPGASPTGSQFSVPSNPNFAFLGSPGAPTWILPETQNPNLLWPGLSTERIAAGVLQGNQVQLRLDSVSGPGTFHLFNADPFGGPPAIRFASTDAFPQTLNLGTTTHAHYSWAFSATGTYTVTLRATATLTNGTPVTSGPVAYTFRVGAL